MSGHARALLVSGSTRAGSTNTAALLTAASLAPDGVTTGLYGELAELPAFNPDHDGDLLPDALAKTSGEPLLFKGDDHFVHTDITPAITTP